MQRYIIFGIIALIGSACFNMQSHNGLRGRLLDGVATCVEAEFSKLVEKSSKEENDDRKYDLFKFKLMVEPNFFEVAGDKKNLGKCFWGRIIVQQPLNPYDMDEEIKLKNTACENYYEELYYASEMWSAQRLISCPSYSRQMLLTVNVVFQFFESQEVVDEFMRQKKEEWVLMGDKVFLDNGYASIQRSGDVEKELKEVSISICLNKVKSRKMIIKDEWDVRFVPIPGRDYSLGETEITQEQWQSIMNDNPSEFKSPNFPVDSVSYLECLKFVDKLNGSTIAKEANVVFSLPTIEEWEYACRAGSNGEWGLLADGTEGNADDMAWCYKGKSSEDYYGTHEVAGKKPNAWGLYDMHGNVAEWCIDTKSKYAFMTTFCGGSWLDKGDGCKATSREMLMPGDQRNYIGLRLVMRKRKH